MCMPTTDEVVETVRQHLNGATDWVKHKAWKQHPDEDAPKTAWTCAVKSALCNAGRDAWGACNDLRIRATSVGHRDPQNWLYVNREFVCLPARNPDRAAPKREWLYDVSCLQWDGEFVNKVLMAAESEWGGSAAKVLEDFHKLLVSRAAVRVMVYDYYKGDGVTPKITLQQLAQHVHQYWDTREGDTYLLAAFGDVRAHNPRIMYYRINGNQQGYELPIKNEDYYPLCHIHGRTIQPCANCGRRRCVQCRAQC